jgi:predicted esterase
MYNQLDTPYLLFMGGVDKVVDPFLAVDLERESKTKDKTTVAYKDMWHSIWRSDEMGDVTAITQKWIMDRLQ